MGRISQLHPPVQRRTWSIVLQMAKRPEGVSWKESVASGGSNNLPCRIKELEGQGHCFHREWEKGSHGSRYYRYWWKGWEKASAVIPSPPPTMQPETYSANL